MTLFYERHLELLRTAQRACRERSAFIPFQESPSSKHHPPGAKQSGFEAFEQRLDRPFELPEHPGDLELGEEASPYTRRSLGISYPTATVSQLFDAGERGARAWAAATPQTRVGVCMEGLMRLSEQTFENAFATMHTSGQAFMMAFAGSGANSLDRGLEAVAFADEAMAAIPRSADYERSFGPGESVRLRKHYHVRPCGHALVMTCGSYPAWNAYPALFANLATGNPVIVKPHPLGVLTMARAVLTIREVLADAGFDPNLVLLAVDRSDAPIAREIHADRRTAIIDFTGGQGFGHWLETHSPGRQVFTETSGVNHVILESVDELDPVLRALALGVAIFSGQMCTAPQNFHVPNDGVRTANGVVAREEVIHRFAELVDELVTDPLAAAAVCGAVQQQSTVDGVDKLTGVSSPRVVREGTPYRHPDFPSACTLTPKVVVAAGADREVFGPVAVFVDGGNRDEMLADAVHTAGAAGSIANYIYSTDDEYIDRAEGAFVDAGASLGINLVRQRPINFTAAFSDYHVTGLNPAGNASLTDIAFVASRFRIVQSKREIST